MKTFISVIALAATLAACKPAPTAPSADAATPLTAEEAGKIVDAVEASLTAGDSAKIMANYTEDAVFFDPGYNEPTNDRATATKWTDGFVAMKPSNFSPGNRTLQVLDANTFITSGVGSMDATLAKGPEKLQTRYTDVYHKQADGKWLIVHEHLSVLPQPVAAAAK